MKVRTLPDLLAPYRPNAVAEAVGVTGDTVRLWRQKKSAPATENVPALARFLQVDAQVVLDAIVAQRSVA